MSTTVIAPPPAPLPETKIHRIGTLSYTARELALLFFWLLAGDVLFVFIDQIEPRVLPILLKRHGATDQQIAIIVSSFAAMVSLFINPIVSYRSDRKRSRLGRRIPYILWATPFVGVLLALTPFAPDLADLALQVGWLARGLEKLPWAPVIVMFALMVLLYQIFEKVVASIYFYLFRDVVPATHLGRFLTLFRAFGALAGFALNYWIIGLADRYPKLIFAGVGVFYVVGFLLMCVFVREGKYPPPPDEAPPAGRRRAALVQAVRNFVVQSYSAPVYRWTYFTRLMVYASISISAFILFFARDELHLSYDRAGKLMSWGSFAWLSVAYPMGVLLDRWGGVRTLNLALWLLAISYGLSFLFIVGETTFLVFSLFNGVAYWMVMLSQVMLAQQIFHPQRMGQLSAANVIIQSLLIAIVVSPCVGALLDLLKGYHATWSLPFLGELDIGAYRFVYLMLALACFLSLFGIQRVRVHWLRCGGPNQYQPPL